LGDALLVIPLSSVLMVILGIGIQRILAKRRVAIAGSVTS
jgi:hypothetical protein